MNPQELREWETVSREVILRRGKFLTVENHVIRLPDGRTIPDWTWLIGPDAAIVLPMTAEGTFLCFRQTKYAIDGPALAPVGGMLEPDEAPLDAAKRELREEMGYESHNWVSLGSHVLDPNRHMAMMHLFLAMDVRWVAEPDSDDLEEQEFVLLNRDELDQALRAGSFKVLSWSAVVALALNFLSSYGDTG